MCKDEKLEAVCFHTNNVHSFFVLLCFFVLLYLGIMCMTLCLFSKLSLGLFASYFVSLYKLSATKSTIKLS